MSTPAHLGCVLAVTTSFAFAHGGDEDKERDLRRAFYRDDITVCWTPGEGITFDGGEAFRVVLLNQLQFAVEHVHLEAGEDSLGVDGRRLRTTLQGEAFDDRIAFAISNEWDEATSVKDAWIRWDFIRGDEDCVGLRIGQQKTHHGLQSDGASRSLVCARRAGASRTFADARARGAFLEGMFRARTVQLFVGALNSDVAAGSALSAEEDENLTAATNSGQNEVDFVVAIRFDTAGRHPEHWIEGDLDHRGETDFACGASLYLGNEDDVVLLGVPTSTAFETTSVNVHGGFKSGAGFAAQGEFWFRSDEETLSATRADSLGFYIQSSYTLPRPEEGVQWGFGGRVSLVTLDDVPVLLSADSLRGQTNGGLGAGTAGDVLDVTGSINAHHAGHALKTQINVTWRSSEQNAGADFDALATEILFTAVF